MATPEKQPEPTKSLVSGLQSWGLSYAPPMALATLIASVHLRPFQPLPVLLFTPMLLLGSYLNLGGLKIDAAGLTAAWSGLYVLLAARRRPAALRQRFTARGAVRGFAMGLGGVNAVAGGYAYAMGDRDAEREERQTRDRWGIEAARGGK